MGSSKTDANNAGTEDPSKNRPQTDPDTSVAAGDQTAANDNA